MNKSDQIDQLGTALAIAQGEMVSPEKNRTVTVVTKAGQKYTFDYADLTQVIDVSREPLARNGLSVSHYTEQVENQFWLVTMLIHKSGQWISSRYPLPYGEAKEIGAQITYGKRYLMSALLNISADEDKDAEPEFVQNSSERKTISHAAPQKVSAPIGPIPPVTKSSPLVDDDLKALVKVVSDLTASRGITNADVSRIIKETTGKIKLVELTEDESARVVSVISNLPVGAAPTKVKSVKPKIGPVQKAGLDADGMKY